MGWPVARRPILDDPAPTRLPGGSARVSQELDLSQNVTLSLGGMRPDRRLGAASSCVGRVSGVAQIGLLWGQLQRCAASEHQPMQVRALLRFEGGG
jgi:hypothetical protein